MTSKKKYVPGYTQGFLTIIEEVKPGRYKVECKCGVIKEVPRHIFSRHQISCGCRRGKDSSTFNSSLKTIDLIPFYKREAYLNEKKNILPNHLRHKI